MQKLSVTEWRRAKGFSIEKVAEALEISPITWRKWELTPSLMPLGKADTFCALIGVSPEEVSFLP